jgi:hypothetical protein
VVIFILHLLNSVRPVTHCIMCSLCVIFKWFATMLQWKYSCIVNLFAAFHAMHNLAMFVVFTVQCILCMEVCEGLCVT